ncbi:DHA1 family bicyclomycin/chloramphenicol resistance-like MFS transporter [Novosphingobium sp. PhB57]|uniref:multidrug effflux MFS transporter n=1 Tax=Novosphingobium sp. PhB57 TaxID=2485107 RepID=UPI0010E54FD4|nr:multidrug effflux MFS transporter [Novosphingobium sp. PhB57]TCU54680.1 DHA1 family bicyclomycin/chloramphenicol resistance-like MFS transporter [Novosphingobium sp. PhB57]
MAALPGSLTTAASEGPAAARRTLAVLGLLMGFASISTDFYLPALPTMARALHSDSGTMAFTISGFLIGFSLGQLFWGPMADRYGRRRPTALGIALFLIGSAGCALSGSAAAMIAWRLVQAIGASAGVVLGRAMVRDIHEGDKAAQMLSTLMTVMAIAPLIGPIAGAQILTLAGWRAIFWTLVLIGIITLAALATLPETLPPERRNSASLGSAFASYRYLILDRRLLGYGGACGLFFGGTFAYIAGSPFAYIAYHHVPAAAYGLLIGAGIIGMMVMNLVNAKFVSRLGLDRMLLWGAGLAALGGIATALAAWTDWGGVAGLAVPIFLFVSSTGLIGANAVAGALSAFPRQAGAVGALVGAMQYGGGVIGSALAGAMADGTPRAMGVMVAMGGLGSFACAAWLRFGQRRQDLKSAKSISHLHSREDAETKGARHE